jgi:CheY-like chemotaxis protein
MNRILVVDESSSACSFVAACLRNPQYNISAATSIAEASNLAKLSPPDLVIVNLAMKDMMQFVTTVRTTPELAETPVIGLSDPVSPQVWQHASELRVTDFLPKDHLPVGQLQDCVACTLLEHARTTQYLRSAA